MLIVAIVSIAVVSFLWALLSLRKAQKELVKKVIGKKQKEDGVVESAVVFQAPNDSSSSSLKPDPTE